MAALLLNRQGLALTQRAAKGTASRASVLPARTSRSFPQRQIVARAAAAEVDEAEDVEDDDELDSIYNDLLEEDTLKENDEGERLELDDEDLEAFAAVEGLSQSYAAELAAEAALVDELTSDPAEKAAIAKAAERMFAEASIRDDMTAADEALFLAAAGDASELAEGTEVDDIQTPLGFSKYDTEVQSSMSVEQRESIQELKLTKGELKNLVPQNWDTINIDWFTNKRDEKIPLPEYKLNVLWMEKNIAVAVDQVYSRGQTSPLTEYFFWPRKDAWEELKAALESRPWILERDKVILLNRLTEIINFWQDEKEKHSIDEARTSFPDCSFAGA